MRLAVEVAGYALAGYWLLKPLYTGDVQVSCIQAVGAAAKGLLWCHRPHGFKGVNCEQSTSKTS